MNELDVALTRIVERHAALRTALIEQGGRLWQHVLEPMPIKSRFVCAGTREEATRLGLESACEPFDLGTAPLFRSFCIGVPPEEYLLVLTFHHAIFDAWSLGIFLASWAHCTSRLRS